MFPAKNHGLASKGLIVTDLKVAAHKSGFCLVTARYQNRNTLPSTTKRCRARVRALAITLQCDHGRLHREEKSKSKASKTVDSNFRATGSTAEQPMEASKRTSAKRPLTRVRVCPFRLTIYLIREDAVVDGGR